MRKVNIKFLTARYNGHGVSVVQHDEETLQIRIDHPGEVGPLYWPVHLPDAIWIKRGQQLRMIPRSAFIEITILD